MPYPNAHKRQIPPQNSNKTSCPLPIETLPFLTMNFKVKKIKSKKTPWKEKLQKTLKRKEIFIVLIFLLFGGVIWGAKGFFQSDFVKEKTSALVSPQTLKKDEFGHTNILILGVGGKMTEGAYLSDSIMIASINPEGPSASIISFPRDLFVSSEISDRKVNEIYATAKYRLGDEKGLQVASRALENFSGIDIHYQAVIDFKVFEELIDFMGGFDIFVPEAIEDPFYPDENYGYQTFVVRKGNQRFNGETALKYARSRKTTSDYSRAKRQQDILFAIQREMEKDGKLLDLIKDTDGIHDLYKSYKSRINTNLTFTELIALARVGIGIQSNRVSTAVLNDDPSQMGGLLYTPARELFKGQFVLLPENLQDTQLFIRLVLLYPQILQENTQIEVLNGSATEGIAGSSASRLRRLGFHVIKVGNFEAENKTPVFRTYIKNLKPGENEQTIEVLKKLYDVIEVETIPEEEVDPESLIDIQLILGTN